MKKTDYLLPFIMKISLFCLNYSIFDYWSLQKKTVVGFRMISRQTL